MAAFAARGRQGIDIWPGFVDALASVLMVFIFMLLIFVVAQLFLSDLLLGREGALQQLSRGIHELLDTLSVEREKTARLSDEVQGLRAELDATLAERDALDEQLVAVTRRAEASDEEARRLQAALDSAEATISADKAQIELRLREIASLQEDVNTLRGLRAELEREVGRLGESLRQREQALSRASERGETLQRRVGELESTLAERDEEFLSVRDRSMALSARLASEEERTRLAQVRIEHRDIRLQALTAQVRAYDRALEEERELTADSRAQVALLNSQIGALRDQIASLSAALALEEAESEAYKVEIAELGQRLNQALVRRVEELDKFRSDFFGQLRAVLGDNPDIEIVGDRFLFKSELLFPSGSAALEPGGREQLDRLAATLQSVSREIPSSVDWILRIDGHTDRRPIRTARFPSNWELSAARALSIVNYLVARGIPPHRLAAAGFGEFRPIDPGDSAEAYARNRRIELKLTGP